MSCENHWEENVSLADGNKGRPFFASVFQALCTLLSWSLKQANRWEEIEANTLNREKQHTAPYRLKYKADFRWGLKSTPHAIRSRFTINTSSGPPDNHTKTYQAELQTPPVPFNVNLLRTKSDNIKFILVIPTTRDKTDWWWQLRTRSHKINLTDTLGTSPSTSVGDVWR